MDEIFSPEDTPDLTVGVVGMGYVGVCLSTVLADAGLRVRSVDVDVDLVDEIEAGTCPISEPTVTDHFESHAETGRISATTDLAAVAETDVVMVTVGTPLEDDDRPDLSSVETVADQLGEHLREGQLVVFRSTVVPGTTADVIAPRLESGSGLTVGEGFDLAFCPERMAEGSAYEDMTSFPVIVGGVTYDSGERAETFFADLGFETIRVSDATTAELEKLSENWWIDLNIAIANELGLLAERLGVDAYEVREVANTLPIGDTTVSFLFPGSGVGGSCLPKDPYFIVDAGEQHGLDIETPRVSRRVNARMPGHVVELTTDLLALVDDPTVAVLGYAFKSGTDDTRHTPAKPIVDGLREAGITVRVTDPYVDADEIEAETGVRPVSLSEALAGVDAVVVVTAHEVYESLSTGSLIEQVGSDSFAVVDGRRTLDGAGLTERGVEYRAVGDGRWFQ